MNFYMNQAAQMETYMTIMMQLGYVQWTSTVDESMWPSWMCATNIMHSLRLCAGESEPECMGACDSWAKRAHDEARAAKAGDELAKWRALASDRVVARWTTLSNACTRSRDLCDLA